MNAQIIGGTSGLGLEIAKKLSSLEWGVYVTGRRSLKQDGVNSLKLDLNSDNLVEDIDVLVAGLPNIDMLVYSAGFYQEGTLTDLKTDQIEEMLNVGSRGLIYSVRALLLKQNKLDELVTITSTSAWTPRKLEPVYNLTKAGAQHLSNGIAEDERIGKVLVAGPAGMQSGFWDGVNRDDLDKMLDPVWVAKQIVEQRKEKYKYKSIRILRQPARVEIQEKR